MPLLAIGLIEGGICVREREVVMTKWKYNEQGGGDHCKKKKENKHILKSRKIFQEK
jgi:hypothetical protein